MNKLKKLEGVQRIFSHITDFFTSTINLIAGILIFIIGILSAIISVYFKSKFNDFTEVNYFKLDNIAFNIIGVLVLLLIFFLVYKISKKISLKMLVIIILTIIALTQLIWIFTIKFPPRADQMVIVNAAKMFMSSDYTYLESGSYLDLYPFQLGMVYFTELIFTITGSTNPIIMQILNILASAVSIFCLYKLCFYIFKKEDICRILLLLCMFFLPIILYVTFVYGTIFGLACSLSSLVFLYKYFDNGKIRNLFLSGLLISCAIAFKSNYSIFLVAMCIEIIRNIVKNYSNIKIINGILYLVIVICISKVVPIYTKLRTNYDIEKKGVPIMAYIKMGMEEGMLGPGWYNYSPVSGYHENNNNPTNTKQASWIMIKERMKYFIKNPLYTANFYGTKIGTTWLNPTFQSIWINIPGELINENLEYKKYVESNRFLISFFDGKINKIMIYYLDFLEILVFVSTGSYILITFKRKKYNTFIISLIFIGGFTFHILSETKSLYVIQYYFLMLIVAAKVLYILFENIETILKNNKSKLLNVGNLKDKGEKCNE